MSTGNLHKLLLRQGHSKVVGVSPPDGNQKPLEELTPGEMILHFENSSPEEEKAAYDLINTLDFSQPLPGIPRLEEFTNAVQLHEEAVDYILEMSNALDLLSKYIESKPILLRPYWEKLKVRESMSDSYVKVVEDAARMYNIPIVDLEG